MDEKRNDLSPMKVACLRGFLDEVNFLLSKGAADYSKLPQMYSGSATGCWQTGVSNGQAQNSRYKSPANNEGTV